MHHQKYYDMEHLKKYFASKLRESCQAVLTSYKVSVEMISSLREELQDSLNNANRSIEESSSSGQHCKGKQNLLSFIPENPTN
ncbi:unnamed protein product [Acanthoscelides obtectus]|uniref:Uncharacterized protein n=1 Tax=Acanthoscelides obtectus TaxID=200917 RepID=A0A9P0KH10_ACAOB|nr:unnamed protein product [Acanthoscelides obtectus]CAK1662853.1 hypothetical protein AOBTE_LOCUS23349 [Acanthoscelides obtectus]